MHINITTASPAGSTRFRRYAAFLAMLLLSVTIGVGSYLRHDLGPRAYGASATIATGPQAITSYDPIHSRSIPAMAVRRPPAAIATGPQAITSYDPIHSRSIPASAVRGW